jgi:phospholipid/cholesterol/gamma-HCH transport system substrate-binding protein
MSGQSKLRLASSPREHRALRSFLRERTDPVPGAHRPNPRPAGIAILVVLALLLVFGFTLHVPIVGGHGGRLVRAVLASADEVTTRTPVRVGGVDVGKVDHIERGPSPETSIVVMRITDDHIQLRRDATVQTRWRTLLGNVYIDLHPGSPAAGPLGGATIPLRHSRLQVSWDDFNTMFGRRTRQGQRQMIAQLRTAFTAPRAHTRTLRTLGPALSVIGPAASALRGSEQDDLTGLVRATATTLRALSVDRPALEQLISGANRTLAPIAHRRVALGRAVELAPPAMSSATTTMRRLITTLDHLDPLVARLRPGARMLAPATRALSPALRQTDRTLLHARPLLHAAAPALSALGDASHQGSPVVRGLDPTVRRLNDELVPYLRREVDDLHMPLYQLVGPTFGVMASGAGEFDASGNWMHFAITGAPNTLVMPCDPGVRLEALHRCTAVNDVLKAILGRSTR